MAAWSFFERFLPPQLYPVIACHTPLRVRIFFGTTLGTTREAALRTAAHLGAKASVTVTDLSGYDADDLANESVVLFFLATAAEGTAPPSAAHFCALVREHTRDFRVGKSWLHGVRFAVVGFGSDAYPAEHYCTAAAQLDADLGALGASRLLPLTKVTDTQSVDNQVSAWLLQLDTMILKMRLKGPAVPQQGDEDAGAA